MTPYRHARLKTQTYRAWIDVLQARLDGADVCERWAEFKHFFADMGTRPRSTTLVRIDEKKAYGPRNCRWTASSGQDEVMGFATPAECFQRINELHVSGHTEHEIAQLLRTTRMGIRDALRSAGFDISPLVPDGER